MGASGTYLHALVTSTLLLGATLYPAFKPPHDDGFPLSTYPMFGRARPTRIEVVSAQAQLPDGRKHAIEPALVGSAEAMQALQTLRKSIAKGKRASGALCERIASRIAQARPEPLSGATQVLIVTETHDALAYLRGETLPLARSVHARCEMPQGPAGDSR